MKKIITISFLLLIFFSQIGYYFFYAFQQYELKEEAKRQLLSTLPKNALEIIDGTTYEKDIEWEEEGKEFFLHGQLYDVAEIKVTDGRTLIYCLNDTKEEQLLQKLAKAVNAGNDQTTGGKHGQHIIKFQLADNIILAESIALVGQTVRQKHLDYSVALVSTTTDVNSPPPDLILYT